MPYNAAFYAASPLGWTEAQLPDTVQFLVDHIVTITLAIIGIAAVLIWVNSPTPAGLGSAAPSREEWRLPSAIKAATETETEKRVQTLSTRNLWGTVTAAALPEIPHDPAWRIAGVITVGAERQVVLNIENRPVELLKVGGKLPGGSQILSIGNDRLCVLVNGQRRELDIRQR